jgi:LysM repeat protein
MQLQVRWPAVPRQIAICATGCLLIAGSLGLTLRQSQPLHSAGYHPSVELFTHDVRRLPEELLGMPEIAVRAAVTPEAIAAPTELRLVEYTVQEGDTIWEIAIAHGTDEETILALNEVRPTAIQVGTTLKIPNFSGVVYKVRLGDTVGEIAAAFGLSPDEVMKHNQIGDPTLLQVGYTLLLPGAQMTPSLRNQIASRGVSRARWIWPVVGGRVTSEYGPRWGGQHNGLDVGVPQGTPVMAARSGTVTFAGLDGSYGLAVLIDHGDGFQTRYAHASAVVVKSGDWVNAGDLIMRVGDTGLAYGPHLHFEIIVNGSQVNPRGYLP